MKQMEKSQGRLILYHSEDGRVAVDVRLKDETIWLNLNQMAELFERDKSVISRHLRNIFKSGELVKTATVAKFATVRKEGDRKVTRYIEWYNLDGIISVGYRVNSKRGTQFRIWATSVLKDHLVQGYTLNQKRLAEKGIGEAQQMLALLADTLESHQLVNDEGQAVLSIVRQYAQTWRLLWQYDEDALALPAQMEKSRSVLELATVRKAIAALRSNLMQKAEATDLFGNERNDGLAGILGAVQQTFGGRDLYPSIEEKAAHLLYFVINDHPFLHTGKPLSFVYDIADLFKFDSVVQVAFKIAARKPRKPDREVRIACRDVFRQTRLLKKIIPAVEEVLAAGGIEPPPPPKDAQPPAIPEPESIGDAGHRSK